MALGQLVVKLGLDAAEFTQGLSKAEVQARKFGESIGEGISTAAKVGAASILSIGAAALTANAAFNKLLDGAAKFQDLAEETGASAASIAGLSVAAATAGVQIESVAGSMNKLTKNLVGVDDESKAAGAGLAALGINVQQFKTLDPAAQYAAISKALAGFADGAGKTAVAMSLFGKSGAEQLKVLKALEEQGGATNILTEEQIALADEYRDKQSALTAQIGLYASAIASSAVPAVTALTTVLKDAIVEVYKLDKAASDTGKSNPFAVFAEDVGRQMAKVLDYFAQTKREFSVLTDLISAYGQSAATFSLKPVDDFKKQYGLNAFFIKTQEGDGKKAAQSFVQAYDAQLANAKRSSFAATDPRRVDLVNGKPPDKPQLVFNGSPAKGAKEKDTSAQEAKAQLASDLDAIKNAQEAITSTYANQEKILEALRAAGLKDETTYYQEKQRLLAQTASAQEDGLQKQITRLKQEQLTGKDAIDNAKKIADAEAALVKVREGSATQAQVLSIQQEAAYKRIASSILSARQAAQDFFDTTNRGYERELAGVGQGDKARNFNAGITQIEDRYRSQRQDLQNQRAQAELAGTFTPDAQKQFDASLAIINEFQTKSIASYKSTYEQINEAQKNWLNGATEALHNYADEAANVAKHTQDAVGNAFKGLEDQLTNLFTGKKFDAKALIGSITSEFARNMVKENITGPLASLGLDFLGGGKGSAVGATGNAALAASTTATSAAMTALTAATTAAAAALSSLSVASAAGGGSDVLGAFISGLGGLAGGGNLEPWGMARVNENGPELLDVNGKQYLMNGGRNARVTPNHRMGGGRSMNIYYQAQPGESRNTAAQNGRALADQLRRIQARDS
ncbi:lambda family phage tail tape measure protein [Variovorax boronicumulans]|uniref:phage tail tape measure protein n=1 Tax=Variovorax boronicumulans TaxID=436515 RepID=UPI00278000B2|nr:phage tail tape measure protein [Variovorax boronicumulans]MDP9991962.1 lambda family phage tail tape measure protein [Variovorax boronicumulans]MDQ0001857.1 lambda family phage tail tape measure protein [Variovorax boronicumulans]